MGGGVALYCCSCSWQTYLAMRKRKYSHHAETATATTTAMATTYNNANFGPFLWLTTRRNLPLSPALPLCNPSKTLLNARPLTVCQYFCRFVSFAIRLALPSHSLFPSLTLSLSRCLSVLGIATRFASHRLLQLSSYHFNFFSTYF